MIDLLRSLSWATIGLGFLTACSSDTSGTGPADGSAGGAPGDTGASGGRVASADGAATGGGGAKSSGGATGSDGGKTGTGGGGAFDGGTSGDASDATDGAASGDVSLGNGNCIDRVGSDNHVATIFNHPNGVCDTYGSFTLTVSTAGAAAVANVTFFRTDSTGLNLGANGVIFARGVWTTQVGSQNIPGNYVAHLFIATGPNPGPSDFVALTSPLSLPLVSGANKFYYFADRDDQAGGNYGFGVNIWLGSAAAASPTLSGFTAVPGGTVVANGTTGCSPAYDGTCGVSADSLATSTSTPTVTLTSFIVAGVGGASAPPDAGAPD